MSTILSTGFLLSDTRSNRHLNYLTLQALPIYSEILKGNREIRGGVVNSRRKVNLPPKKKLEKQLDCGDAMGFKNLVLYIQK